MKHILKAMSLSLVLASPLTFSLTAQAQESPLTRPSFPNIPAAEFHSALADGILFLASPLVAQSGGQATPDQEADAFYDSKFNYWDAKVLANFWNEEVGETKSRIGRKLLWGAEDKAFLEQQLVDARIKALGSVEELQLYSISGFTYDDAEALAEFWGVPSPWESKLRIERNLILGQFQVVSDALELSRKR